MSKIVFEFVGVRTMASRSTPRTIVPQPDLQLLLILYPILPHSSPSSSTIIPCLLASPAQSSAWPGSVLSAIIQRLSSLIVRKGLFRYVQRPCLLPQYADHCGSDHNSDVWVI